MTVGERLRYIRKSSNLTLEEFGSRIGMKKNSLSQIENGKNSLTEQTLMSVCREFNANPDWIRSESGDPFVSISDSDAYRRAADAVATGSHEMDRIVRGIITYYGNMDDDCKSLFLDYLHKVSSLVSDSESKHTAPDEETLKKQYETKDVHDNAV